MAKSDLLFNDDFQQYQKLVISEGKIFTKTLLDGNIDPVYFRGAMEMFRRITKIPLQLADNEDQKEVAGRMIIKAFNEYEAKLLKSCFIGDDE